MKFRSIAGLFVIFCGIALTTVAYPLGGNPGDEMKRSAPVGVGEQAPDFTLEDIQGNQVTLSATRGKAPTVVVGFTRTDAEPLVVEENEDRNKHHNRNRFSCWTRFILVSVCPATGPRLLVVDFWSQHRPLEAAAG